MRQTDDPFAADSRPQCSLTGGQRYQLGAKRQLTNLQNIQTSVRHGQRSAVRLAVVDMRVRGEME